MIKVLGKEEYLKYIDLIKEMKKSVVGIHYPIDCPWIYDNTKISENDIILDIGCGYGGVGQYIAKMKNCRLYGLDQASVNDVFKERCIKYGILNTKFIHSFADHIPCPNEYFDAVISISALEHNQLDIVNQIVKEIARVLKNGKRLTASIAVSTDSNKNGDIYFKSEEDVIYAFTDNTGMRLVDTTSLTGWKWNSEEVISKYREYVEFLDHSNLPWLPPGGRDWLPIGVIIEKN